MLPTDLLPEDIVGIFNEIGILRNTNLLSILDPRSLPGICIIQNGEIKEVSLNWLKSMPYLRPHYSSPNELLLKIHALSTLRLQKLYICHSNLSELPAWIARLNSLEELYLVNNKFTEIPEIIKNLTSLKLLNMDENQIKTIPSWIGDLKALEELHLRNNAILDLPEEIKTFSSLKVLEIDNDPPKIKKRNILEDIQRLFG